MRHRIRSPLGMLTRPPHHLNYSLTHRLPRFTTRGIVALVFSCLAGILGVAVVAWYGFADPVNSQPLGAGGVQDAKKAGEQGPESSVEDVASGTGGVAGTGRNGAEDEISPSGGGRH